MKTIEIEQGTNLGEISEGDIIVISGVERLVLNISEILIGTISRDNEDSVISEERYWKDNGKLEIINEYLHKKPRWNEANREYERLNQILNEVLLR